MHSTRLRGFFPRLCILGAILAVSLPAFTTVAHADAIRIVALGASNAAGYGLPPGQAWPALLQQLLREKGYDVSVTVAATLGDTSAGILNRVDSAVPAGTRVVLFDVGAGNDRDKGASDTAKNEAEIEARIRARGAEPVFVAYARIVGSERDNPSAWQKYDPHHHLTADSHARVAAALLPKVVEAIDKSH